MPPRLCLDSIHMTPRAIVSKLRVALLVCENVDALEGIAEKLDFLQSAGAFATRAKVISMFAARVPYADEDRPHIVSALRDACRAGRLRVAALLIELGVNLNCLNGAFLRLAAENGHRSVVELLLDNGALPHLLTDRSIAKLSRHGNAEILALLNKARAVLPAGCLVRYLVAGKLPFAALAEDLRNQNFIGMSIEHLSTRELYLNGQEGETAYATILSSTIDAQRSWEITFHTPLNAKQAAITFAECVVAPVFAQQLTASADKIVAFVMLPLNSARPFDDCKLLEVLPKM